MDLSKTTNVTKTFSSRECNDMIAEGWVLVSVASGQDEQGYPIEMYILANMPKDTKVES